MLRLTININLINRYIMRKKNFQVTAVEDGKKYWISPSVVVACIVFINEHFPDGKSKKYVLASKRGGNGACSHMWSITTGFLDFGETVKDAAVREVYEETGLKIEKKDFKFLGYVTDTQLGQVSFRFLANLNMNNVDLSSLSTDSKSRGGEEGEVEDVKLIPIDEVKNYKWAFNHLGLIGKYSKYL